VIDYNTSRALTTMKLILLPIQTRSTKI